MADIDLVIAALRTERPGVVVQQLARRRASDDDGLWFVRAATDAPERAHCQIESSSHDLPFLVESDKDAFVALRCDEAVAIVEAILSARQTELLTRARTPSITTPEDAISWLAARGAHPWLVRHHELVLEAARVLVDAAVDALEVQLDRQFVLVGAAVHDAGKMIHTAEMSAPGHRHEEVGRALLIYSQFGPVSRVAVSHARWSEHGTTLEDRFVALADKLWKGKRDPALENAVVDELAERTKRERWDVFVMADEIFDRVASGGPDRLARSQV